MHNERRDSLTVVFRVSNSGLIPISYIDLSYINVRDSLIWGGYDYGVATMSRMLKNICLFAEYRSLL